MRCTALALSAMTAATLFSLPTAAEARTNRKFGAGVILGDPTGLSAKYFLDRRHALDFALNYDLNDDEFHFHAGYLLHLNSLGHDLQPYVGIGGRLRVHDHDHHHHHDHDHDDTHLGARVPLGLAWMPGRTPIDIFIEVAPVLNVIPDMDVDVDAGLGVRYWF